MLNAELLKSIDAYIKLNYVETTEANKAVEAETDITKSAGDFAADSKVTLEQLMNEIRASFQDKLFSKIRSNPLYHPRKQTVLAPAGIPNDGRLCTCEQILKMRQNWYGAFEGERSACMLLEEHMSDEDGNWSNDLNAYESVVGSACLH